MRRRRADASNKKFEQVMVRDDTCAFRSLQTWLPRKTICCNDFRNEAILRNKQFNSAVVLFSAGCTIGLRKHLVAHFVSKAEAL